VRENINLRHAISSLVGILISCSSVLSATIRVPTERPTIQAGIDFAINGDTVLVSNGIYKGSGNRNIDFGGKQLVLQSASGREFCTIDCELSGRAFIFTSGEDSSTVVQGFTIQNGSGDRGAGGAVYCANSSPKLIDCIFRDNSSINGGPLPGQGGAIYCINSSPKVTNCIFHGNRAGEPQGGAGGGGAICCVNSSPQLSYCKSLYNRRRIFATCKNKGATT